MSDARIHEMIARACLGARSDEELAAGLRGFLERHGVAPEDVEAICAAPPRLAIYRRLVRNTLFDVVVRMMPRTQARLNDAGGAFDASFVEFLDVAAPRTHYLRDVPHEFLAWAAPRWRARAELPAYLIDLAEHELVRFSIAVAPVPRDRPQLADIALDRPLVFAEAKRLVHYAHAVHELPEGLDDRSAPAERAVSLLGYRDADCAVRFLELTPLASAIVARLFTGEPLGAALGPACADGGVPLTDAILADTARLLADLGERGILLGFLDT